jgi:hypothetical protein
MPDFMSPVIRIPERKEMPKTVGTGLRSRQADASCVGLFADA